MVYSKLQHISPNKIALVLLATGIIGIVIAQPANNSDSYIMEFGDLETGETKELGVLSSDKIQFIQLKAKNEVFDTILIFETASEATIHKPDQKTYGYAEINSNLSINDFEEVKIRFKVEKSWLETNNISENSIILLQYQNGWKKANTTKITNDQSSIFYEAKVGNFTKYAIASNSSHTTNPTNPESGKNTHVTSEAALIGASLIVGFLIFSTIIFLKKDRILQLISEDREENLYSDLINLKTRLEQNNTVENTEKFIKGLEIAERQIDKGNYEAAENTITQLEKMTSGSEGKLVGDNESF